MKQKLITLFFLQKKDQERFRNGSGTLEGWKIAWKAVVPAQLQERWASIQDQYIPMVEQSAVVMGLLEAKDIVAGRDVIWYEDNSVVLSGLVKGASGEHDLDQGSSCVHLGLAVMKTRIWWEYIGSKANWSDEASRGGDSLLLRNGFLIKAGVIPTWPWTAPASERLSFLRQQFKT